MSPSQTDTEPPKIAQKKRVVISGDRPKPPTFSDKYEERAFLKGRLALAYRIFARYGFDYGTSGHITVKDPVDTTCFWVNPLGVDWKTLKASDLLLVNSEGQIVEGGPVRFLQTAAFMIHHAVHVARADIIAVAHSHTTYAKAFSALGKKLDTITQDSCVFHGDHTIEKSFTGAAMTQEPGEAIAEQLGPNKLIILQNHGILTVGKSLESAVWWFIAAENACQVQLLADAAAAGRGQQTFTVDEMEARRSHDAVGSESVGWHNGRVVFLRQISEDGGNEYEI